MQAKLTWDRDPGEPNQDFAGGRILYFGGNKKFGFFSGIVLRQSGRLALSEGEGGNVYSGTWNADSDGIWVDYRLVHSYKVSQLKGEKPPEIPGPLKHASILLERSEDGRIGEIQQLHFGGVTYEAAPGFRVSELRSILKIFERTGQAKKSGVPSLH